MTSELTYLKLLQKVNRNSTQSGITLDRPRAVLLINEAKNRWVEQHLKDKDSILIDSIQEIIKDIPLTIGSDKGDYMEYQLVDDFYEDILVKCEAEKGTCKGVLYSREAKNQNKNILQFDENQRPDFDWEWTFHSIQGNTLRVYKTPEFKILKSTLEYYKVIPDYDILGYINIDNKPSSDKPLILSDQYVDQILNLAAEEYMRDFENAQGLQIAKDRTKSQE